MAIEKLTDYRPAAKVNPYAADLEGFTEGDAFAVTFTPTERKVKDENGEPTGEVKRSIAGAKSQVQDAANAIGFTAREAERTENEDGTIRVVFVLGKRQESGPRKGKDEAEQTAAKSGR